MKDSKLKSESTLLHIASKLADILKQDQSAIPYEEYDRGKALVSIYQNPNFSAMFMNLSSQKQDLIKRCLADVSSGGDQFMKGVYQVVYTNGQLELVYKVHGEKVSGEVVFYAGLKEAMAFQNHKKSQKRDLSQENLNHISLYLVGELAKVV